MRQLDLLRESEPENPVAPERADATSSFPGCTCEQVCPCAVCTDEALGPRTNFWEDALLEINGITTDEVTGAQTVAYKIWWQISTTQAIRANGTYDDKMSEFQRMLSEIAEASKQKLARNPNQAEWVDTWDF